MRDEYPGYWYEVTTAMFAQYYTTKITQIYYNYNY